MGLVFRVDPAHALLFLPLAAGRLFAFSFAFAFALSYSSAWCLCIRTASMPLEQTITVVNNSGKIISTGKQLLSVFKEAKGAYQDKKAQLKSEKSTLSRSQTFDQSRSLYRSHDPHVYDDYYEEDDDYYYKYDDDGRSRRQSHYAPSEASTRRTAVDQEAHIQGATTIGIATIAQLHDG